MVNKKVAVIGSGASGLPSIRHGLLYGADVTCFEASDDVGGLWRYKSHETNESSVMKTTVINTSKEMTSYSDFPPKENLANFMHNTEMLNYLKGYAEHHGLMKHIKLRHKVLNVERSKNYDNDGTWKITYETPEGKTQEEIFDGVLVCSGHHAIPHWPTPFPGQDKFKGRIVHSHSYKDHKGYEDKVVVVVGVGNSGIDVAVEQSRIAKQVYLVTRRGTWLMPKLETRGLPFDVLMNTRFFSLYKLLPQGLLNSIIEYRINQRVDHDLYGIKPSHRVFSAHPSLNDELPNRIANGTVRIKPNIKKFDGYALHFEDGTIVPHVDEVVMSTGFSFEFDLVEHGKLVPVTENEVDLFKYMFPVATSDHNSLCIIGLIQPFGSIMPVSEQQARVFFANLFSGNKIIPTKAQLTADIENKKEEMAKQFVKSRRHTIQVDYIPYMDELAQLIGCQVPILKTLLTDPLLGLRLFFGPNAGYCNNFQARA
uniref:Flavin-containing monooxygenase n=1 Tax=Caenorhabditis japonica TaxID=281687 RepID=A0A8R1DKB1_CAEJA